MATIFRTVEDLRASGEQGALLADAASQVHPQHISLILALYSLLTILVKIGYLSPNEVHWPPHQGKANFDAEAWAALGLGDEASSLLNVLTFGAELWDTPIFSSRSFSQSYMGEPDFYARDPFLLGYEDEAQKIPPQYLLLAPNHNHSPVLLYDTNSSRLAWWDMDFGPWHDGPTAEWMQILDWRSIDLLNNVSQSIIDLELVPSSEAWGYQVFLDDPKIWRQCLELPEIADPLDWYVNKENNRIAQQRIYREHGWPGPDYRREEAVLASDKFREQRWELYDAIGMKGWNYIPAINREGARAYMEFLQHAAGPDALLSPTFEECDGSDLEPQVARMNEPLEQQHVLATDSSKSDRSATALERCGEKTGFDLFLAERASAQFAT